MVEKTDSRGDFDGLGDASARGAVEIDRDLYLSLASLAGNGRSSGLHLIAKKKVGVT